MNEISLANSSETLIKENGSLNKSEEKSPNSPEPNMSICGMNIKMTKTQLVSIILLSLTFFFNWAYYSLFAPFFPEEAINKGLNTTQIGIIFGVFQLVLLIFSPVFGKYVSFLLFKK